MKTIACLLGILLSGCGVIAAPMEWANLRSKHQALIWDMELPVEEIEQDAAGLSSEDETDILVQKAILKIAADMKFELASLLAAARAEDQKTAKESFGNLMKTLKNLDDFHKTVNLGKTSKTESLKRLRESSAEVAKTLKKAKADLVDH